MFLKRIDTGLLSSNCYVLGDAGKGVVIDPGAKSDAIMGILNEAGLGLECIILTHAHLDHIVSVDELREKCSARVFLHKDDAASLGNPYLNGSELFGLRKVFGEADVYLKDGDIIKAGDISLKTIHTPGHTPGSICLKTGNIIFSGDTLFRMSIGRTDLGNGDDRLMAASLKKLMMMEDDVAVYPGHGDSTTIGFERRNNPFL